MRIIRLLPLAAALLIAGCGDDAAAPEQSDGGSASGEILPASVTDEMITPDRLRSQPPRLIEAGEDGAGTGSTGASAAAGGAAPSGEDADAAPSDGEAEEAPAATPADDE